MKLYTKAGDGGRASTMNRRNIPKDSPVFELLGTLDELGSALGAAKCAAPKAAPLIEPLQSDLIRLCGELAGGKPFASEEETANLERVIDSIQKETPEFSGFILPGKTPGGAALDQARTIARRAERRAVTYSVTGQVSAAALKWLNRLSDLIYALARLTDLGGAEEPPAADVPGSVPAVRTEEKGGAGAGRKLDLRSAAELCEKVLQHGRETGLRAVVSVVDEGGNLIALMRDDDAFLVSIQLSQDKAYTAVAVKMTTEQLGRMAQPGAALDGIQHTNCRMVVFGGGVPITQGGRVIGGLGVSGGTAQQDTDLADYGAQVAKQMFDS